MILLLEFFLPQENALPMLPETPCQERKLVTTYVMGMLHSRRLTRNALDHHKHLQNLALRKHLDLIWIERFLARPVSHYDERSRRKRHCKIQHQPSVAKLTTN